MQTKQNTLAPSGAKKPTRRVRPEVAASIVARRRQAQVEELYSRPVQELEPEELARMKAAFFRS